MKTLRIVTLAAALLAPNAHAQGGVETMFDEALEALCSAQGALTSVPMGEMAIEIPGISAFGVDIRPLCQYADIVGKGTKTLKDLRNGTFRVTEDFINNTLAAVANTIGARVGTEKANELIEGLDSQLRTALDSDDAFLSAYREATRGTIDALRESALDDAHEAFGQAIAGDDPDTTGTQALQRRLDGFAPYVTILPSVIGAEASATEQSLEVDALNRATTELLEQQLENNAHQQTIEDTLRVGLPGEQGGIAQSIVQDAQRATSVRQSINVLSEAIAAQLRNDAVLTGAVIESLQANARQQAITNHQLNILAQHQIAEIEQEVADAEAEFASDFQEATQEMTNAFEQLNQAIDRAVYVTSTDAMDEIGFSFCGLFGDC